MNENYDTYGFENDDIESLVWELGNVLRVTFERRDSSFLGDYFRARGINQETFQLLFNHNTADEDMDEDDYWHEPEFKSYPVLLRVNNTSRPQHIFDIISRLNHLRVALLKTKVISTDILELGQALLEPGIGSEEARSKLTK
ncbi:MAG: hypothetical protein SF123_22090 [Chloroflexota bacterium]|nr:hypothetical protein [Chloroflexota bacterium]